MDVTISLCGWDIKQEESELLYKISSKIRELIDVNDLDITDLKISEVAEKDIYIAFGDVAYNSLSDKEDTWKAPTLSLMLGVGDKVNKYRQKTIDIIKEIADSIKREQELKDRELYVETQHKSIGLNGDIKISMEEAKYLKTIKDILGGGTIVIRKGDSEIRIEKNEE